jgi:hypothetical protein
MMKKTSFAVATLVASLSLAFVVPASYAESKAPPKASCHTCKQCKHDKKCDKCDKTSEAKKNHKNCTSCNHNDKK